MLELVSRDPLTVRVGCVLLDEYRLRLWTQRVIQLGKQEPAIDVDILNERADRVFLVGYVFGGDDDIECWSVVDEHLPVAIKYHPARRGNWNFANTIILGARLVVFVTRHLEN